MITDRYSRDEIGRVLLDGRPLEQTRREPACACGPARYRIARAAHRAALRFRARERTQYLQLRATLSGEDLRCFARHYYAQLAKEATR